MIKITQPQRKGFIGYMLQNFRSYTFEPRITPANSLFGCRDRLCPYFNFPIKPAFSYLSILVPSPTCMIKWTGTNKTYRKAPSNVTMKKRPC